VTGKQPEPAFFVSRGNTLRVSPPGGSENPALLAASFFYSSELILRRLYQVVAPKTDTNLMRPAFQEVRIIDWVMDLCGSAGVKPVIERNLSEAIVIEVPEAAFELPPRDYQVLLARVHEDAHRAKAHLDLERTHSGIVFSS
jgi:hypothetical protein